jgi:hypothetical protein
MRDAQTPSAQALFYEWAATSTAMLQQTAAVKAILRGSCRPIAYALALPPVSVTESQGMAGYSGTPLAQKLGIKPDSTVVLLDGPAKYRSLLGPAAESVKLIDRAENASFVHLFVTKRAALEKNLRMLRTKLMETGIIWVSWPKKASGVKTDITEDAM